MTETAWNCSSGPARRHFVLPLTPNQCLSSSLHREIHTSLTSRRLWRDRCLASLLWSYVMYAPLQSSSTAWLFKGRTWHKMNDLYRLLIFLPDVVISTKRLNSLLVLKIAPSIACFLHIQQHYVRGFIKLKSYHFHTWMDPDLNLVKNLWD